MRFFLIDYSHLQCQGVVPVLRGLLDQDHVHRKGSGRAENQRNPRHRQAPQGLVSTSRNFKNIVDVTRQ